ncbi:PARP3 [Symbiodinium sp. CCMP2592]|nr:PARP3 [Symbiodinium sp. CCMP2592]
MCSRYFSVITHTAEKTLEDYLAFFQAIVIAHLLLVVLYAVQIAFHVVLMDSDNHTATFTDMLVLALGACVVLLWLVDAALSTHFGSRLRKASISDSVNPEKVDALVHRNRVCTAVGSFALTIYLARFCVELLQASQQGQMAAMQECIVVLAPVLFVKVIRLLTFHSFGCWVRTTAGTASV